MSSSKQAREVLGDARDHDQVIPAEIEDDLYTRYITARHSTQHQGGSPVFDAATGLTADQRESAAAGNLRERSEMILFDGRIGKSGPAAGHIELAIYRVAPSGYKPGQAKQGDAGWEENQDDGGTPESDS
jgi:hypothetical protein